MAITGAFRDLEAGGAALVRRFVSTLSARTTPSVWSFTPT
jgi:hypothetical protein